MNINEILLTKRSIRMFKQIGIDKEILKGIINAGRLASSSANLQPLKYVILTEQKDFMYNNLKFAGYLKHWKPRDTEKPMAYIVVLSDTTISEDCKYDVGLALGNMTLYAFSKGMGSCILASLDEEKFRERFRIDNKYKIELTLALGYPSHTSKVVDYEGDINYFMSKSGGIKVPKRELKDLILFEE